VDATGRTHGVAHLVEKKAVGTADLEQIARGEIGNDRPQRLDSVAKIGPQALLLGNIVEVFAAVEIVRAVERRQLGIGNVHVRTDEPTALASDQAGQVARPRASSTNNAISFGAGLGCGHRDAVLARIAPSAPSGSRSPAS